MIKSSIKLVVLPLFIAILLTSFYVMQPQMVDAATKRYKNSGSQSDTPLASDRFDDIAKGYVPASKAIFEQKVTKGGSTSVSDSRIDFILEQYVDCERDSTKGTCKDIFFSGKQNVALNTPTASNIDANFDLTMIQKDDTEGQDNVRNTIKGDQIVTVTTSGNGKFDGSHNSNNNEVDLNIYQYNKRGGIPESLSDFEIDSITDAIKSDSGSGNDDSFNINEAKQNYIVNAKTGASINVANSGSDQAFTIAQFNADCDDHDLPTGTIPDITCKNVATQNVKLDAQGSTTAGSNTLNFNTLSPIELQQVNTCQFSNNLNCLNQGLVDVSATTTGTGSAKIELENPNGKPVVFQQNECNNLDNSGDCKNISNNFFDIQKSGTNSKITQTNFDLQVAEVNKCDTAKNSLNCINQGLESLVGAFGPDPDGAGPLTPRNIQAEFSAKAPINLGGSTSIVTVNAVGANSEIQKADPDSILKMINDCGGNSASSSCVNAALNEAHFVASSGTLGGGKINVEKIVQTSSLENKCDNLDVDPCGNFAYNTFTAAAANTATINLGSVGATQTNTLLNNCNDADCFSDGRNLLLLTADNGAQIKATPTSTGINQNNKLTNNCNTDATCEILTTNRVSLFADKSSTGQSSTIDIQKLNQNAEYTNNCSYESVCKITGLNNYNVINTSGQTLTVDSTQNLKYTNNVNDGSTSIINQQNMVDLQKSSGTNLQVISSQTGTAGGAMNQILGNPAGSGTCSVTQSNPPTTNTAAC
jgi:hypothetical protein